MATNWPNSGISNVGEFQVSGHTLPITGSSAIIKLNYVASSITVAAIDGDRAVTFYDGSHNAVNFTVPVDTTAKFKGKFLTFKVPANASALVELTNIPSGSYSVPTFTDLFYE
jgi:hypothetical protein|tara:strand:+ start:3718 stop:4056 length:339 start_codon:yes stop_codon:yes gene_type:complete